jgi:undecaprenyl-diphosphatase
LSALLSIAPHRFFGFLPWHARGLEHVREMSYNLLVTERLDGQMAHCLRLLASFHQAVSGLDAALFKWINTGWACPTLDHVMVAVTTLGEGIVQIGLGLFFIVAGLVGQKVNWRRAGYAGLIACAFSGATVQIVKALWDRPRPLLVLHDVRIVEYPLFVNSFPSGHATTAFAVLVALSVYLPRLRYVLIPLAFVCALSRVYIGVHFPLDVVYGGAAGALIGIGSARFVRPREPKTGPRD